MQELSQLGALGEAAVSPSTAVSTLKEVSSGAAVCKYWKGRSKEGSLEEASFLRMCRSDSEGRKGQLCRSLRNIRLSGKTKVRD